MLQFNNLLVPLDFSDKNQAALDIALEMARPDEARVTLLHVIENIDLSGDHEVDDFVTELKDRATQKLEAAAAPFRDAGVTADCVLRLGKRSREIAAFENDNDIDLIIVSSHSIDAESPHRSVATLSYQIAVMATCNVMLVK